jgi:hypothetical protein
MSAHDYLKKGLVFNLFKNYKKYYLVKTITNELKILKSCGLKEKKNVTILDLGLLAIYKNESCAGIIKGMLKKLNVRFTYNVLNELQIELMLKHNMHGVEITVYKYLYSYR